MMRLIDQSDGDLAARVKDRGDDAAFAELAARFHDVLTPAARAWRVDGLDPQDIEQNALLGLWDACHAYDGGDRPFAGLVSVCARHRIQKLVTRHSRLKSKMVTYAASIHEPYGEGGYGREWQLHDYLPSTFSRDPYEVVARREELFSFTRVGLRGAERDAVVYCLVGVETTNAQRCALLRARKRIRAYLDDVAA